MPTEGSRFARRENWLAKAVLSGFVATMAMFLALVCAYAIAAALSATLPQGADTASRITMAQWLYGLTHNQVVDTTKDTLYLSTGLHFFIGLALAVAYGYLAEPRLWGPGWVRGTIFSLMPWMLSLLVFLPLMGGGILGLELRAGPLPILGNLTLHLTYGAVLGLLYSPAGDLLYGEEESLREENLRAMASAEKAAAWGVVTGMVLGIAVGIAGAVLTSSLAETAIFGPQQFAFLLGSCLIGGALGALLGSLFGLPAGRAP